MVDIAVHQAYRKNLSNITLEERVFATKAFKALQHERLAKAQTELAELDAEQTGVLVAATENGSFFSASQQIRFEIAPVKKP